MARLTTGPIAATVPSRSAGRTVWVTLLLLILIILGSAGVRASFDWPEILAGTLPSEDSFELRYVQHPVLAYLHIAPGVVYIVGAPFQLSRRFRERHFTLHRRMGRVLLALGLTSGILGIVVGIVFPYGGLLETSASVVFGAYFVTALVVAFVAIRGGDVTRHRRWMIRAFAVGIAIGTARIWMGLFQLVGLLAIQDNTGTAWFGAAFCLSFPLHALAAELYLSRRPGAEVAAQPAVTA